MKRSYVILIAGAVIFIAGIAIFQVYANLYNLYGDTFLNENTIVKNSTIQPGQSINISRETVKAEINGKYTSKITNLGTTPVTINAVVGQLPIINENDQGRLDLLNGVLAGIFTVIIGIIVLIAGGIILIKDRRKFKTTRIGGDSGQ